MLPKAAAARGLGMFADPFANEQRAHVSPASPDTLTKKCVPPLLARTLLSPLPEEPR